MGIDTTMVKIVHKVTQLRNAEERLAKNNTPFNFNNYQSTRRTLHLLALILAKQTED